MWSTEPVETKKDWLLFNKKRPAQAKEEQKRFKKARNRNMRRRGYG